MNLFNFTNGDLGTRYGLCSGMVFAAKDYERYGLNVPPPPAPKKWSRLWLYIYYRQITGPFFTCNFFKLIASIFLTNKSKGFIKGSMALGQAKTGDIIGLIKHYSFTKSHCVLANGWFNGVLPTINPNNLGYYNHNYIYRNVEARTFELNGFKYDQIIIFNYRPSRLFKLFRLPYGR